MAARTRYYGVYVGVITLLAFHVQKDSGVTSFYLNGLRPVFHSLKPKESGYDYNRGQALLCYSCSSKNNEACVKPDVSEYSTVHCDMEMLYQMKNNSKTINKDYENIFDVDALHPVGVDLVCLKVVVQEGNKKYVLRGCQLGMHSNLDICTKIEEKSTGMFKMIHCSKCNKDACNSSMKACQFNAALTLICLVFYQAVSRL